MLCDYYTRKSDGAVFAIKTENGRPVRAVGPLDAGEVGDNPVDHDFKARGVDARRWRIRRDFIPIGRHWVRYGPQLRQKIGTTFRPAGASPIGIRRPVAPSQRIFAPGFIIPSR